MLTGARGREPGMIGRQRDGLPPCKAGECLSAEEIHERFDYIKAINGRTSGTRFLVVEAHGGFHAFIQRNGKFYATASYPSLEDLEGYVF
ncbi:MAG: hypothetical protein ACYC99_14505 [Candidatus Geothermincolia bacterium]